MRVQLIPVFAIVLIGAVAGWADDKPKEDQKIIQGDWEVVDQLPEALPPVKYERLVFKDDKLIFHSRLDKQKDVVKTEFKLDSQADPKEIDFTPLEGGAKGEKYLGIYELLKDGKLIIAYRGPGEERPKNLNAKQKENQNVVFIYLEPTSKK
jgi:uncharacterized protein (TIGR03067 family)